MMAQENLSDEEKKIYFQNYEKLTFQPLEHSINVLTSNLKDEEKINFIYYSELLFFEDQINKFYLTVETNQNRSFYLVFDRNLNKIIHLGESISQSYYIHRTFGYLSSLSPYCNYNRPGILIDVEFSLLYSEYFTISSLFKLNTRMVEFVDRMVEIMAKTNSIEIRD